MTQWSIVNSHIATLEDEAAAERLSVAARSGERRTHDGRPSLRAALGRRLIAMGSAIAANPIVDEPCADGGAAQRA